MMHYFVGFTCSPAADAGRFLAPLQHPKNYVDPTVIRKWTEKANEDRAKKLAYIELFGRVQSLAVLDQDGQPLINSGAIPPEDSYKAVHYLMQRADEGFVWGLNIMALVRMLAHAAVRCKDRPGTFAPPAAWASTRYYDPYSYLLKPQTRAQVGIAEYLAYLNAPVVDISSAIGTADAARHICLANNLLSVEPISFHEPTESEFADS